MKRLTENNKYDRFIGSHMYEISTNQFVTNYLALKGGDN